jgi:MFS family permease
MPGRARALLLLALAEVFALSTWFSATAVIPSLKATTGLSDLLVSLFASMVSAGFVAGTVVSALMALPDRMDPRRLIFMSALLAAAANAAILLTGPDSTGAVILRFLTGVGLAGVYPTGMKLAATWASRNMGAILGLLIGALVLGTALPHLFNALGGVNWEWTMGAASILTVLAAFLSLGIGLGPSYAKLVPGERGAFRPEYALRAFTDPAIRYANFGYFGHMVELFVMWSWTGLFLHASFLSNPSTASQASELSGYGAFICIGIGALGCVAGGLIADRIGRTAFTIIVMVISGICTLFIGQLFGGSVFWLLFVGAIWGATIVADSGQFSACVLELATPETRGTLATVQTSVGFLITVGTIQVMPEFVDLLSWEWAFAPYAIGPAFGIWAMWKLRQEPDAVKLANGRR